MSRRVVAVANRLPVRRAEDGTWELSPGGLVTALLPILRESGGAWIGWTGVADDAPEPFVHDGIAHHPVPLSEAEHQDYYLGFCNSSLWPLYHDAIREPEFNPAWWDTYRHVNRRFAEVVAGQHEAGDLIWVHDYQLQLVPAMLRRLLPDARIGFFLHIPFPPVEIFARLPWRRQILNGLLGADVVAFQTERAMGNFLAAAERFTDAVVGRRTLAVAGRRVQAQCAPISIDTAAYQSLASSPRVRERAAGLRAEIGHPHKVLLGADRLDYTKGIDVRLLAFERLLEQRPELAEQAVFVQLASPSREPIGDYEAMRARIEQLVGRIDGSHGPAHTLPVHYVYGNVPVEDLVAYYVLADVMCVTPLADGMNLVAKEYIAARPGDEGVLVLSEFAGAAAELEGALLVNPYDLDGLAAAMAAALEMKPGEQAARIREMRSQVRNHDVHAWADRCLRAIEAVEVKREADDEALGEPTAALLPGRRFQRPGRPGVPDALDAFDEIAAALRHRPVMVFLDFDGTLSPIVEDPGAAAMPDAERQAVEALASRVPVAVVSGRDLDDVRSRVGLEGLWYVGGHGTAAASPDGAVTEDTAGAGLDRITALLDAAEQHLRAGLAGIDPGVVIERKRSSIAVHYRRAPQALRRVRAAVEATASTLPDLQLTSGRAIFELRPPDLWDKGTAVRWLLQRVAGGDAVPVYLGDDTTDEAAFRAIEADGVGVLVAGLAAGTAAHYQLRDRRRVADFLTRLAEVLPGQG